MFRVSNRNIRILREICSKLAIKAPARDHWRRFVMSLLVTLNKFDTLPWCFHCWLRTRSYLLGYMDVEIQGHILKSYVALIAHFQNVWPFLYSLNHHRIKMSVWIYFHVHRYFAAITKEYPKERNKRDNVMMSLKQIRF